MKRSYEATIFFCLLTLSVCAIAASISYFVARECNEKALREAVKEVRKPVVNGVNAIVLDRNVWQCTHSVAEGKSTDDVQCIEYQRKNS